LVGSLLAAAGMQVYIVWGCVRVDNYFTFHMINLSKGISKKRSREKLSRIFISQASILRHMPLRRQQFFDGYVPSRLPNQDISCLAMMSMTGWAAGNALVFGEYALKAFLDHEPASVLLKLTSFACVTLTFLLHGTAVEWGLRVQNALGVFKLFVLIMVAATGLVALNNGIPTVAGIQQEGYQWRGRQNFVDMWEGTNVSASSLCLCLYSVRSLFSETVWYELMLFFLFRLSGPLLDFQMRTTLCLK